MRYDFTEDEKTQVISSFFTSLDPMVLSIYPSKLKKQWITLSIISSLFIPNQIYTEKAVNAILKDIYFDYVTIRRSLVDYRFIERTRDGKAYWLNLEMTNIKKS